MMMSPTLHFGLVAGDGDNAANLIHTFTLEGNDNAKLQRRRKFDELAHAILYARRNHEIFGLVLLQHQPLHLDIIARMTPIPQGAQIAEIKAVLQAQRYARESASNLAGDKGFAAHRTLVIEKDAVASINPICLAVVYGDPISIELGHSIRTARIEWCRLLLRHLLHQPVQLRGASLIKARLVLQSQDSDRLKQSQRPYSVGISGVFGLLKTDGDM